MPTLEGFTIKEYHGGEVMVKKGDDFFAATSEDDVKPGAEIYVMGLFGERRKLTVDDRVGDTETWAAYENAEEKSGLGAFLKWAPDDRECWVASSLFSADGIKRLEIEP